VGSLIAGATTKCWVRVQDATSRASVPLVTTRWLPVADGAPVSDSAPTVVASFEEPGVDVELELTAPGQSGTYQIVFTTDEATPTKDLLVTAKVLEPKQKTTHLLTDPTPFSYAWGVDRGLPVHRLHLERFLKTHARDIRGSCLEFQEARYVPRFGG